jgi:hypothetical protein
MKKIVPVLALGMVMMLLQTARGACDCANRMSPGEAYGRAAAVFTGVVKRVEIDSAKDQAGAKDQTGGKDQAGDSTIADQLAYVQVEKGYKGVKEGEIVLHQPDDGCAPMFRAGQRWLFYANYQQGSETWVVEGCSRSRGIDFAADDLLYLGRLPQSASQTRISGVVSQYEQSPQSGFSLVKNVAGAKVKIAGQDKTYEATTDKNGVYEIYGPVPGRYTIQVEAPPGFRIRFPIPFGPAILPEGEAARVDLTPNSSTGADFVVSSDNTISGRVLDPAGAPIANICVDLVPSIVTPGHPFKIDDCTKQDGRYELKQVPPGDYVIVLNRGKKPTASEPYQHWFYPGVLARNKAAVVTVSQGAKLDGYDIRIPRKIPTVVLQGVMSYSDGKPVAREKVSFKADADNPNPNFDRDAITLTDDQGRFSLPIIQGSTGTLAGATFLSESSFPDCPEIKKLLDAKHQESVEAQTEPVRIDQTTAGMDIKNIKLVFGFAACEKK